MKKKILYVGDGRCRINWGARATSEALCTILEADNSVEIVPSTAKLPSYSPILYSRFISAGFLKTVVKRKKSFFFRILFSLLRRAGFKNDYISEDIDESIRTFLKVKSFYPKLNDIYNKIKDCDVVVLNGEGTMILSTPPRRWALFFLVILKLSKQLGKKAYFVNGMISECPVTGLNKKTVAQMVEVFKECDGIALRDKFSYKMLKEMAPDLDCEYIPDALFSWFPKFLNEANLPLNGDTFPWPEHDRYFNGFDFSQPYICIGGSSGARYSSNATTVARYVSLVNKLKETQMNLYLVPTCSGDKFLKEVSVITGVPIIPLHISVITGAAILANAKVFVSGRFHPSILASLGGTPCVFMGSNSHKTLSLQEVLEYPKHVEYNATPTDADIDNILGDVKHLLQEGSERRKVILATASKLCKESLTVSEIVN